MPKKSTKPTAPSIPTHCYNVSDALPLDLLKETFTEEDSYGILLIRPPKAQKRKRTTPQPPPSEKWKLLELYYNDVLLKSADADTVTVENAKNGDTPDIFQSKKGYTSFILQKTSPSTLSTHLHTPLHLDIPGSTPALWSFLGKGSNIGRPLHTDAVTSTFTYHFQYLGTKIWTLKPTKTVAQKLNIKEEEFQVEVKEGEFIFVDTRVWLHCTKMEGDSVSFATDVYFGEDGGEEGEVTKNTNVDSIFATDDVGEGTVVFTEEDMPDEEMCFVKENANCEVVELEGGGQAVVTLRDVKVGEFFTILEDDDDDDEEESEGEGDWGEIEEEEEDED